MSDIQSAKDSTLPDGYLVIDGDSESIMVGVTDFNLQGKKSPSFITYKGIDYKCGPLATIPDKLSDKICSCRVYAAITGAVKTPDKLYFSQRNKLEKIIYKWMSEKGVADCPLNTISFLQQKGLVDIEKIRDFIKKEA